MKTRYTVFFNYEVGGKKGRKVFASNDIWEVSKSLSKISKFCTIKEITRIDWKFDTIDEFESFQEYLPF